MVQHLMDVPQEFEKATGTPSQAYVRDRKAMARTPADVKKLPNAYVFEIDMPGINSSQIKVQVEDNKMLVISGERKREDETNKKISGERKLEDETKEKEKEKEGGANAKYLRMERRIGRFLRTFMLPEDANTEATSATCKDGVLTVCVEKVPPQKSKKPRTIQVEVACEE